MSYTATIVTILGSPRAVILVAPDQVFPSPGADIIRDAERFFPTMPIMLIASRMGDRSATFALWDTAGLGQLLDTTTLEWQEYDTPPEPELPF